MKETSRESNKEYRDLLISTLQESQRAYDKAVLTLSGGALGVSIAFLRDIVGPHSIVCSGLLFAAWLLWGVSVCFVLVSFLSSAFAQRHAITKVDSGQIHSSHLGGWFDTVTLVLNIGSGFFFVVGVILFGLFSYRNMR